MFRHTRPTTIVNQACMFSMVAGAVVAPRGRLFSVMAFTVTNGTITAIDPLADPSVSHKLDLTIPPVDDQRP